MIEVFKTNVQKGNDAEHIIQKLLENFQLFKINFDLEDCDKILRIQGEDIKVPKIIELLTTNGFECAILV